MIKWSVPLISTTEDHLLVPAEQVPTLLRDLAADWAESVQDRETGLDRDTVLALAVVLTDLADQIDVECIAFATDTAADG